MNLRNLKFGEVTSNSAGIRSISFLAKKSDIRAYPEMPDPTSEKPNVTLEGDYVMQDGKSFIQVYTRKGTGKVSFTPLGPKDGKFFEQKAELDYPDIDDDAMDLANKIINGDFVLIVGTRVANTKGFKFVVLGDDMFPCNIAPNGSSASLDSPDDKGLKLEAIAHSNYALPRYVGVLPTTDGEFDCETGLFKPAAPTTPEE